MARTAIVTGSARGIGKCISMTLASKGINIAVIDACPIEGIQETADEIKAKYGVETKAYQCNVTDANAVKECVADVKETFGSVDILINNAAIDLSNLYHLKTAAEFRKTLDVNVIGAYNCSKICAEQMLEKQYGKIINITSTNGINTYYPMSFDYDASKAALISLTHNLATQYAPYINVNAIAPGFIGTESELDGYDEEFLKEEENKIMKKRYGRPEEVAYLVKFLISQEADYINNTVIRIDGGQNGSY